MTIFSKARMVNPCVAVMTMTDEEDGATAYVMCSLPGGRPLFSLRDPSLASTHPTPITNAPALFNLKQLTAFVTARFGDDR